MSIDKGEFAKSEVSIRPAVNGGYVVSRVHLNGGYHFGTEAAFTDYQDLLSFLTEEYRAANVLPSYDASPTQQDRREGQ